LIFLEKLSKEVTASNIDMMAVGYGTLVGGSMPRYLPILAQVDEMPHYKEIFLCKAQTAPRNKKDTEYRPVLPRLAAEKSVFIDNLDHYMKKTKKQRERAYFVERKELSRDEIDLLSRIAIISAIEDTKKTESYYINLLDCSRGKFRDRYSAPLEMFCGLIDDRIYSIELKARKLI
jgi:hypothetical protein